MNQRFYKNMALWVVLLVTILLLVTMLNQDEATPPELAYSQFLSNVEDSSVESVMIEEGLIKGKHTDGTEFTTYAPVVTQDLITLLREHEIKFEAQPKDPEMVAQLSATALLTSRIQRELFDHPTAHERGEPT